MNLNIKKIIFLAGLITVVAVVLSFKIAAPARKIKLGFISLTDCAPLIAAKELGLFAKYGLDVELEKQASWAVTRD